MEKTIQYSLRLLNLHCYLSGEGDADEVFLKMDGEKIWPKDKFIPMKEKSLPIKLEFKVEKGGSKDIEIWDYDFWSKNDLMGTIHIEVDKMGGPYNVDMIKHDKGNAKYSLEYEIM